jgi:hypothetical protein
LIPAQLPIVGSIIAFRIFDKDNYNDQLIGTLSIALQDLISDTHITKSKLNRKYCWKNIYGSPSDCKGSTGEKMNLNPEIASLWKGRILM